MSSVRLKRVVSGRWEFYFSFDRNAYQPALALVMLYDNHYCVSPHIYVLEVKRSTTPEEEKNGSDLQGEQRVYSGQQCEGKSCFRVNTNTSTPAVESCGSPRPC